MNRAVHAIVMAVICLLFVGAPVAAADDFSSSPVGKELISIGMKFLDNPGDFFYNLHSDNQDFSPVPADRRGAVRFNFFPTFLPLTWGNLSGKVRVLGERASCPQIDIGAMYGDLLALHAVQGDVKPQFTDYAVGVTASKSMDESTQLFGGAKYSAVVMEVAFSTPVVLGDFRMNDLKFTVSDTMLFAGIRHKTGTNKAMVAQVGYGVKYQKIVARVMATHKHLELGMDIFPEGLFVFHPFLAWHWYF